jgi:hypothetical protein
MDVEKYNRITRFSPLSFLLTRLERIISSPVFPTPSFIVFDHNTRRLPVNLQQIGIRAHVFELSKMPLETRFLPRRKKTG